MLVLTRKPHQSVVVGENMMLTVTVLAIENNHVRLGFNADKSVAIVREELLLNLPKQEAQPSEGNHPISDELVEDIIAEFDLRRAIANEEFEQADELLKQKKSKKKKVVVH